MGKDKLFLSIMVVLLIILAVFGSTYAYWSWTSANTNAEMTMVNITTTEQYSCSADGGGNITSSNYKLAPTDCTDSTYAIQRTITTSLVNNLGREVYFDLWLEVNSIGANLSASENFKYALTSQANNCTSNVISSGTFNGTSAGSIRTLLIAPTDSHSTSNLNGTYYLYIWLDEAETNNNTMSQNFNISLQGRCSEILYGDANGDGSVSIKDITRINRYINSGDELASFEATDVNSDGVVNATDLSLIQSYTKARGKDVLLGPH